MITYGGLFEVVQNVVLQNEPSSMFALVFTTLFSQPSFSLWVKECLSQVTHARYLKLFFSNVLIECLQITSSNQVYCNVINRQLKAQQEDHCHYQCHGSY